MLAEFGRVLAGVTAEPGGVPFVSTVTGELAGDAELGTAGVLGGAGPRHGPVRRRGRRLRTRGDPVRGDRAGRVLTAMVGDVRGRRGARCRCSGATGSRSAAYATGWRRRGSAASPWTGRRCTRAAGRSTCPPTPSSTSATGCRTRRGPATSPPPACAPPSTRCCGASITLARHRRAVAHRTAVPATHPWLADHARRRHGRCCPAPGCVELAVQAGDQVGCGRLDELTLQAPLVVPDDDGVQVQVAVGRPATTAAGRSPSTPGDRRRRRGPGTPPGLLTADARPARRPTDRRSWPPAGAEPVDLDGPLRRGWPTPASTTARSSRACGPPGDAATRCSPRSRCPGDVLDADRFGPAPGAARRGPARHRASAGARAHPRVPFAWTGVDRARHRRGQPAGHRSRPPAATRSPLTLTDEAGTPVARSTRWCCAGIDPGQLAAARTGRQDAPVPGRLDPGAAARRAGRRPVGAGRRRRVHGAAALDTVGLAAESTPTWPPWPPPWTRAAPYRTWCWSPPSARTGGTSRAGPGTPPGSSSACCRRWLADERLRLVPAAGAHPRRAGHAGHRAGRRGGLGPGPVRPVGEPGPVRPGRPRRPRRSAQAAARRCWPAANRNWSSARASPTPPGWCPATARRRHPRQRLHRRRHGAGHRGRRPLGRLVARHLVDRARGTAPAAGQPARPARADGAAELRADLTALGAEVDRGRLRRGRPGRGRRAARRRPRRAPADRGRARRRCARRRDHRRR